MDGEEVTMDFSYYGFGTERTLKDYEIYSGLRFSNRAAQQYTLDKHYAPNPTIYETEEEWLASYATIFKHCIDVGFTQVPENDYDFWAVIFEGSNGNELYRKDADKEEINRLKSDKDGYCKIWRDFQTTEKPNKWIVWPHSESKGWCEIITGNL
jgi:hypothetical protein